MDNSSNDSATTSRGPVIPAGSEAMYERFHFAPAYRVGDTVFVSGVIGNGEDPGEQFASAFEALAATLAAAGSSMDKIVDMTSYHVDMSAHLGTFMAARDAAMSEPWPAWTAIGCTELAMPHGLAEIKVTAVD
ncbi:MAG: Rid family hydrolase [Actinomycetota bacterium]